MEDLMTQKGPIIIDNQDSPVYTLLFNKNLDTLLVGYQNGTAIQYKRRSKTWMMQKNYGKIGIGKIISCDHFGNIAVMGGNLFKLRSIKLDQMELIGKPLETSPNWIYTLQLCKISSKMHLVVGGLLLCYLNDKTDVFDTSKLFENKIKNENIFSKILNISPPKEMDFKKRIKEIKKQLILLKTENVPKYEKYQKFIKEFEVYYEQEIKICLLYTSPSPRDLSTSRMPSSA